MLERVRGFTDAVMESAGPDVARTAGELEAFQLLLAGSEDLTSVLSNHYVPIVSRRAIVDELLAGRVSPTVVDLLRYTVQDGAGADYLVDLDGVVAVARARRAGLEPVIEPMGRVATTERLDGYASAVLGALGRDALPGIEDDLFRFGRIAEGNEELRVALTTPELPATVRASIVRDLLGPRASDQAARMAAYAALWGRPRDFLVLVDALTERVARETDRRVADVRATVELDETEKMRLAAALTRYTGSPVDVRVTTQAGLLGGFVASVGDVVVDASLRHRLEQVRELLFAPTLTGHNAAPSGPASSGHPVEP